MDFVGGTAKSKFDSSIDANVGDTALVKITPDIADGTEYLQTHKNTSKKMNRLFLPAITCFHRAVSMVRQTMLLPQRRK